MFKVSEILLKVREINIILDIILFSFKFIERLNNKPENYVKHVMFSVQMAEFKVSEILLLVREKSGKNQGIFFILMCGNPDIPLIYNLCHKQYLSNRGYRKLKCLKATFTNKFSISSHDWVIQKSVNFNQEKMKSEAKTL